MSWLASKRLFQSYTLVMKQKACYKYGCGSNITNKKEFQLKKLMKYSTTIAWMSCLLNGDPHGSFADDPHGSFAACASQLSFIEIVQIHL